MKRYIFILLLSFQAVTWSAHSSAKVELKFGVIGLAAIVGACTFAGVLLYKHNPDKCDKAIDDVKKMTAKVTEHLKKNVIESSFNTTDDAKEKKEPDAE